MSDAVDGLLDRTRRAAEADGPLARARRATEMLRVLAVSDLRMRYGRSGMRPLKWLLEPLAALGVFLVLIVFLLDRGEEAPGLSLACAIVPFQLVVAGSINAYRAVEVRNTIIANMAFPRILLPLSAVVTESITASASLLLLPLMMLAYGVEPTIAVLWLPLAIVVTIALAISLAYPFSLLGVWYPELQPFVVSLVRTMFFIAPSLIALDQISEPARSILLINPLTGIFEAFRDALLYGQAPAAWQFLIPLGFAAVLLVSSVPIYRREQAYLAKLVG